MRPYLSVVIPCYNEEQNIRLGSLDKVAHYLEKQPFTWEVLIIDDGSTDESVKLINKFVLHNHRFKLIPNHHQGKAGTVVFGMLKAAGGYVLFTDLDQATPLDQVEKLFPWVKKGYDIAIGSRSRTREGAPLLRRLMGPGFMIVRNLVLGLGDISDTQCGFKLFKKDVVERVFDRLRLFKQQQNVSGSRVTAAFDVEVLFVALQLGYQVKEVPVEWHYVDTRRVSPFIDSLDAFIDIFRIRLNSIRGFYTVAPHHS